MHCSSNTTVRNMLQQWGVSGDNPTERPQVDEREVRVSKGPACCSGPYIVSDVATAPYSSLDAPGE